MPAEVTEAGVDPLQWENACKAMVAVARVEDNARQSAEADVRREVWPEMRNRLEQGRCRVTNTTGEIWRIVGTGISIDIDLSTGDVEHSDGQLGEQLPAFERITDYIIRSVEGREADEGNLARREERRKTHQWDNTRKVWLPRNGVGPIIRQGK